MANQGNYGSFREDNVIKNSMGSELRCIKVVMVIDTGVYEGLKRAAREQERTVDALIWDTCINALCAKSYETEENN